MRDSFATIPKSHECLFDNSRYTPVHILRIVSRRLDVWPAVPHIVWDSFGSHFASLSKVHKQVTTKHVPG